MKETVKYLYFGLADEIGSGKGVVPAGKFDVKGLARTLVSLEQTSKVHQIHR